MVKTSKGQFGNMAFAVAIILQLVGVDSSLPSRSRIVRDVRGASRDNGHAIEGQAYRQAKINAIDESIIDRKVSETVKRKNVRAGKTKNHRSNVGNQMTGGLVGSGSEHNLDVDFERELGSQLTGCCYNYKNYYSSGMCGLYGHDCEEGSAASGDNGEGDCSMEGLSFIGISFSVNTASGNPYSYQLCDQFPMENIIDRDYNYVMSMDEDGWLVGGGYKTFDYSGKMPYIDSSHTELLRVGSMDPDKG